MRSGYSAIKFTVCLALLLVGVAFGSPLELGSPFADGMVLQRGLPLKIWGFATPGARVKVCFANATAQGKVAEDGRWLVTLPQQRANGDGRVLTVSCGNERLEVRDVLVGEVWLVSGQSNMDVPLVGPFPRYRDRQGALVAQMSCRRSIRFARSEGSWSRNPLVRTQKPLVWRPFTPENLGQDNACSAVAAYFALDLEAALNVPVGLLCAYCGGTNIDSWTPREGTASVPELKDVLDWTYYDQQTWPKNDGRFNDYPWNAPVQQPAVLWNGLVAPLTPYAARGLLWYQGCHNHPEGEWQRYCKKMHALFNGWRQKFENPGFVIRFAQLGTGFSTLCQQQAQFEREEPASAMAVVCDVANPDDIHPNEKRTVAHRLAVQALRRDYGFKNVKSESPSVVSVAAEGTNLVLLCRNAETLYVYNEDRSLRNNFEIAGADGRWQRATLVNCVKSSDWQRGGLLTDSGKIVLTAPGVLAPQKVRYWYSPPYYGAVYNEVNLPLGPFEADVGGCLRAAHSR